MIGVDPHKGSHTAVAIGAAEEPLGQVRVRASAAQAQRLLAWSAAWPQRTWAVGGAGGLGHLLDWQLVAAGEQVLGVPPELSGDGADLVDVLLEDMKGVVAAGSFGP
jgi:transposase